MARKNDKAAKDPIKTTEEYYKLHRQAVEDLVTADESNSPQVSQEELDKYRHKSRLSLSDKAKVVLTKIWFAGAVCFFIFWGLGIYVSDRLDMLVIFGIALGIVTDLLTNNVVRFFAKTQGENDRYMMFPRKGYASFPLNILYALLLLFLVSQVYNLVNLILLSLMGGGDTVPLGVEPILFGVFYTAVDHLLLGCKRLLLAVISDAKKKAGRPT